MPAEVAQRQLAPGRILITLWEYPRGVVDCDGEQGLGDVERELGSTGKARPRLPPNGVRSASIVAKATCIALVTLAVAGCRSSSHPANATLRCDHVTWQIPAHWYGQVRRSSGGLTTFGIATFPLPRERDAVGEVASTKMHESDIRILLIDYGDGTTAAAAAAGHASLPLTVKEMTVYRQFEHMPPGHSMARKPFELDGRLFDIQVEFGGEIDARRARRADDVLRRLRVRPKTNPASRGC
jgi:hypothetical protein